MSVVFKKISNSWELFVSGSHVFTASIDGVNKHDLQIFASEGEDILKELSLMMLSSVPSQLRLSVQFKGFVQNRIHNSIMIHHRDKNRKRSKSKNNSQRNIQVNLYYGKDDNEFVRKMLGSYYEILRQYNYFPNHIYFGKSTVEGSDPDSLMAQIQISCVDEGLLDSVPRIQDLLFDLKRIESLISLRNTTTENVFIETFNFPKGYESICSQYLMWFGEFLSNLGVDAKVSVESESEETKIIVSPEESSELLDEVERLFYQYLVLPYGEILPPEGRELTPIEQNQLLQMKNQINYFQMQIQNKDAVLQLKDATIASQQTTIYQKDRIIQQQKNDLILLESLVDPKEINIGDGAVKLGEYEAFGVKINYKKSWNFLTGKTSDD